LLERFLAAAGSQDREAVMKLLSEEVEYRTNVARKVAAG
jgi:hypothetical protein